MESFRGRRIKIVFNDGTKIVIKIGVLSDYNSSFVILDNKDAISINRIVRIENISSSEAMS